MSYWKWALGLAPLCALGIAAIAIEQAAVEQEVASRAARVVAREVGRLHVGAFGRDVTINSDIALPEAVAQRLHAHAGEVPGVRRVVISQPEGEGGPVPSIEPFLFEITRTDAGMSVAGHAPGAQVRDAVLSAVRSAAAPGGLAGELTVAWGAPAHVDFEVAARFAAVQAARLVRGRVAITGDELSVSGKTADVAALNALLDAVRPSLPGGLRLGAVSVQAAPPMMKPFTFVAERTGAGLALAGGVPAPETRALLLDMAREIAGAAVTDRMAPASGAHEDFPTYAAFGLMKLSRLAKGRFSLTDTSFSLEGDALDSESYDAIMIALGAAPMGLIAGAVDVRPPLAAPFAWSAALEGGALVLRGAIPDAAAAKILLDAARSRFPAAAPRSEARLAMGAPDGFVAAALAGLAALERLESGRVETGDRALAIIGRGREGVTGDSLRAVLAAQAPGFAIDLSRFVAALAPASAQVSASASAQASASASAAERLAQPNSPVQPATPVCPDGAGVATRPVLFASGRAKLPPGAAEMAREIVALARACPGLAIEVSGHTDAQGGRRRNLRLSYVRARAVARLLAAEGAPRPSIVVQSFAYDRPLAAPEIDADDRSRNRRVDVVLRSGGRP